MDRRRQRDLSAAAPTNVSRTQRNDMPVMPALLSSVQRPGTTWQLVVARCRGRCTAVQDPHHRREGAGDHADLAGLGQSHPQQSGLGIAAAGGHDGTGGQAGSRGGYGGDGADGVPDGYTGG